MQDAQAEATTIISNGKNEVCHRLALLVSLFYVSVCPLLLLNPRMGGMENLMDFEPLVMHYLSAQGLFLSPQFSVRNGGREWSCPDFVALDFRACEIQVVEVTTAYNVNGLIEKIKKREDQWFFRLRPQLISLGIPDHNWKAVVRAFVRRERAEHVKSRILNADNVRIEIIEDIAIPWSWPWDKWKAQSGAVAGAPQAPR